ncbi:MAG: DUF6311 domain-containing protein [Vicinamibacterales bacterium]
MGRVVGALVGAVFFLWIAGTRSLDPGEIGWLMRYDWPIHFFGWHFFRVEPWHWPPGRILGYGVPAAPPSASPIRSRSSPSRSSRSRRGCRPRSSIGPWLLLSFTLQGLAGAWLASRWTTRLDLQVTAAAILVMMPVLLIRIGHPSLCAHWLLLWVLIVASRDASTRFRAWEWALIGLIGGLLHPYLAVMTLGLLTGVAFTPAARPLAARAGGLAAATLATVFGWWMSGLFAVSGAASMATEGLGNYSMNLLAPIMPVGWSTFLPEIPLATPGQAFEGFQYLGLGVLLLLVAAVGIRVAQRSDEGGSRRHAGFGVPLVATALVMAVFALSPRVTAAGSVLVDVSGPWTAHFAVFRATGRFFWPLAYLALVWALSVVILRLPPRVALSVLLAVAIVQAIDLHGAHQERRISARDPEFYAWSDPMRDPAWTQVLAGYEHLVLYPPPQCGQAPMPFEPAAYHAGLQGLTINTGNAARPDEAARLAYCHALGDQLKAGQLADDTIYLVPPAEMDAIRHASGGSAVCGDVATVPVCATRASVARWSTAAELR